METLYVRGHSNSIFKHQLALVARIMSMRIFDNGVSQLDALSKLLILVGVV